MRAIGDSGAGALGVVALSAVGATATAAWTVSARLIGAVETAIAELAVQIGLVTRSIA